MEKNLSVDAPEIKSFPERKMVGKRLKMCLQENRTVELWNGFMTERKSILKPVSSDLYSVQIFEPGFKIADFNLRTYFEKWAATEVADFHKIPTAMESFVLVGGLYAVFLYTGGQATAAAAFKYIYTGWLPASQYQLDERPHFEILDSRYKNNDESSQEQICIPIRAK